MISTLELTKAASQKEGSHYGATKGSDATEGPPADATHSERFRDNLFAFLDGPCMFKVNIANIIIIIVNGAFFFCLLVGMHTSRGGRRPSGRRSPGAGPTRWATRSRRGAPGAGSAVAAATPTRPRRSPSSPSRWIGRRAATTTQRDKYHERVERESSLLCPPPGSTDPERFATVSRITNS